MGLLSKLAREAGAAVVVVTHDPRLRGVADRIFMMEDGTLIEETPATREAP